MKQNNKLKETLKLLAELEDLLPDFLEVTSSHLDSRSGEKEQLQQKKLIVREKMVSILERSKALQWATDCMPAADAGRNQSRKKDRA